MLVFLISQQSQLTVFIAVLVFGLVVGVSGHVVGSRPLILTGILVIGVASALFSFVLRPGAG